jgi:hypothetical protein
MAEIALPDVVTAVADSALEGFVAGTLYSQGWNVVFRALDASSLLAYVDSDVPRSRNVVLIYSPDLPGISPETIAALQDKVRQVVGFSAKLGESQEYVGLFPIPLEPSELLNLVRGFVRAPLVRNAHVESSKVRRTRVVAIGSSTGSAGCTSLALNLSMELSALGHETVLIDADVRNPSIAPLLSLHKLDQESSSRTIASHLSVSEFTRERVPKLADYLDELFSRSDFVVIDLGSLVGISDSLTDRRWTSSMIHWSCERADALWLVGKCDVLGMHRLETLVRDFVQTTIRAKVSIVLNMSARGRKGKAREDQYFAIAAPLRPENLFILPRDARSLMQAEEERATLIEIDDRSSLRKSIAAMAVGLTT